MADLLLEMAPAEEPLPLPLPVPEPEPEPEPLPLTLPEPEPEPEPLTLPLTPAPVEVTLVDTVCETPELPALASEANSEFSGPATDTTCSNLPSFSSTPPTSITDAASISSDLSKPDLLIAALTPIQHHDDQCIEQTVEVGTPQSDLLEPTKPSIAEQSEATTPRRARSSRSTTGTPVYNLAKLAGTHIYGKRRANGDDVREKRRRVSPTPASGGEQTPVPHHGGDALEAALSPAEQASPKTVRKKKQPAGPTGVSRRSTRSSGPASDAAPPTASNLGKRSRNPALEHLPRELRRLRDTNEFVGIEQKPVLHTIWSNGKYIDPNDLDENGEPIRKKVRASPPKPVEEPVPEAQSSKEATPAEPTKQKRVKKWLTKGLYAGQDTPADYTTGLSSADKKKLAQLPELKPSGKVNKVLPLPMFGGLRLLINGRDFKLPYDVCNPLPPGQPKPDEWRKMTKNRFIGDAGTYWRKTDHFKDYQSKCICKPSDGCAEDCQNRIMLYECDDTNCNAGKEYCQNRAFQNLTERTKKGGRFRVGVEVLKTSDRGYGVRSNRCFEPNQIIMEYTGEIITEAECERRMNEKYKDNECYYLMAFDQNMIIDATTGSIARFVNHSCDPNCRMEKWIVHGQPRMALFAGDRPIMTGEELTYDYNFDPFSAKNVQKCLCGSANCRGILGPKSKMPKEIKDMVKAVAKADKRKLKAILDGQEAATSAPPRKKQKVATTKAKGVKATARTVKKITAGSISVRAKATAAAKTSSSSSSSSSKANKHAASVSVRKAKLVKAAKVYTKNGKQLLLADSIVLTSATAAPASSAKAASAGRKKKEEEPGAKKTVKKSSKGAATTKKSPSVKARVVKKTVKTATAKPGKTAAAAKSKKNETKASKTKAKTPEKKPKATTTVKKTSITTKASKATATSKKTGTGAAKATTKAATTKVAGKGAIKTTTKKRSTSATTVSKRGINATIKSAKHTIGKIAAAAKKKKTAAATAALGVATSTVSLKTPARKPLVQKPLEQTPQAQAQFQAQLDKIYEIVDDAAPVLLQAGENVEV